ncbi:PREDICTED: ARM REPEAT PROTEIN INTERACTING WITH ABF2-like [Lupinus angustifolius]|uniref:ARM REPEAT PROTEIN INTERACTING WITH ABF2-like n=1 Tax=Lupinus angustifolius TaxID=3871 RepID=UPI00092EB955|nr:PREDICTED: ARM REPEAT PROTEIN INTERACTING WITH ABF2-like [Lupinus angustifolius]
MAPSRTSVKRKLEHHFDKENEEAEDHRHSKVLVLDSDHDVLPDIHRHVSLLTSSDSPSLNTALLFLSQFATNEEFVDAIIESGAVPALVKHLQLQQQRQQEDPILNNSSRYDVQIKCAYILGLLALKPEQQLLIHNAGALPYLIDLLKMWDNRNKTIPLGLPCLLRRAADAITNLAHENSVIKNFLRIKGAIPPLVQLLEFTDTKVQRAATGALRTLAFKNFDNKKQIIGCNALPPLTILLQSQDPTLHYEAVGVIGNLVHSSSPDIKKDVLLAGVLQPVIGILSSSCSESQREAALLIGQFATIDSDCKNHIAQRGGITPLVEMLKSSDTHVREMSAFALGRLAQNSHNQAGIAHNGGIEPLLSLLGSKSGAIQHNAAFALYGLADNEDNVSSIIKAGGLQKLQEGIFRAQPTKECVAKTLKRLEDKMHGLVLRHVLYLMRFAEKSVQIRIALALAHLCSDNNRKSIFIDNNGLELLLDLLESTSLKQRCDAAAALYKLATKTTASPLVDAAPPSPTLQVYLGEQYVNNPKDSDVTFLVEGKRFYAHRKCLLASSDTFRAMLDGGYREREGKDIEIPNINWGVFKLMMRYIYTGTVDVNLDIAHDLLKAADQYLLEGLKRICEYAISQDISVDNVFEMYNMSQPFNATSLRHACILFMLEHYEKLRAEPWFCSLVHCSIPDIRQLFSTLLTKPYSADS